MLVLLQFHFTFKVETQINQSRSVATSGYLFLAKSGTDEEVLRLFVYHGNTFSKKCSKYEIKATKKLELLYLKIERDQDLL